MNRFGSEDLHAKPSLKALTDPWNVEFPPDEDFVIKPVNGVFHIYTDKVSNLRSN
ncbi:hypothetical protein OZD67_02690 [Wolbachia endosymbiont of Drosophila nikananu]|nr:hypothetical protein [Wolbachia endosymbiont of Drosophila nikananu]MDE5061027.1 hypothetical protein [Wolbachia endosymbiont of Drosophila nikananu]